MFGIIIWRIWRLRKRMLNILSIWELRIWHPIVVKVRIILIGISHLCIQTRVKSKQNKTEKTRCHWRIIVWQYYQNVTIYTKQFYCLLKKRSIFKKTTYPIYLQESCPILTTVLWICNEIHFCLRYTIKQILQYYFCTVNTTKTEEQRVLCETIQTKTWVLHSFSLSVTIFLLHCFWCACQKNNLCWDALSLSFKFYHFFT